ncbi:DUF885 domain-containing protein [Gaetbulibacter aestuarii]|uniref:DUF885 domain-containing protein n=1 Tax=Gaetbulibacter aestuarii TaxID=1502358 RepID=A0ABW7MV49_9FLAO
MKSLSNRGVVFVLFLLINLTLNSQNNSKKLDAVIQKYQDREGYDKEQFPLGRFDEAYFLQENNFAKGLLHDLATIKPDSLSENDRISFKLLKFVLKNEVATYDFKTYLNPIQADQGFHLNWNYLPKPIHSLKEAKSYLEKLKAIPYVTQSEIKLMRKGFEEKIMQPKIIFKGYESTYNQHLVATPEASDFYKPFEKLPDNLSYQTKDSLRMVAIEVIRDSVIPSFETIKSFFENEYFPKARLKIGVNAEPNGEAFYQNRINFYTTTSEYTPEDIHNLGLQEVKRIREAMEQIIKQTGFTGSFEDFLQFLRTDPQFYVKTGDDLLRYARDICKRIDNQLPAYFKKLPRQPYGVIPVPEALAPKYTAGRYSGSPVTSTQAGHYLVNTYDLPSRGLYNLPALSAHESVPGHHLQIALNAELGDSIPKFRRNLYLSAYGEGWGLYAEYLADDMGVYRTPYEKFGQLTYEMWRACRLVVDTGIHAMGWSRDEVVNYLKENTALSLHEISTETDRYIGWPGQAISYKMGELKIRELRKKAEKALGPAFDIREFHSVILGYGTVTLPIMEELVDAYITREKKVDYLRIRKVNNF